MPYLTSSTCQCLPALQTSTSSTCLPALPNNNIFYMSTCLANSDIFYLSTCLNSTCPAAVQTTTYSTCLTALLTPTTAYFSTSSIYLLQILVIYLFYLASTIIASKLLGKIINLFIYLNLSNLCIDARPSELRQ